MRSLVERRFSLINSINKQIAGNIGYKPSNENKRKFPAVFILHGFKGSKDWGFFPYISERLAATGAISVIFNFSLNGMREGSDLVENIEDFAANTATQELKDILFLIDEFENGNIIENVELKKIWNGEIYLLGHSLGGAITLLAAERDNRIKKIALWASLAKFDRYTLRQKKVWRQQGFLEFINNSTGQTLRMNRTWLDDFENNNYSLNDSISKLNIPILIVHGRQDLTIKFKESETLIEAANKDKLTVNLISRTGHTFGAEHPFKCTTTALEEVIEKTISFFGLI